MPEMLYRVAREFDVVNVTPTKEGRERIEQLLPQGCCLLCERKMEEDERKTCGNCGACYEVVRQLPAKERAKEIRAGHSLNPSPGGRKHTNANREAVAARR